MKPNFQAQMMIDITYGFVIISTLLWTYLIYDIIRKQHRHIIKFILTLMIITTFLISYLIADINHILIVITTYVGLYLITQQNKSRESHKV